MLLEATCRWARTTPWWSIAASSWIAGPLRFAIRGPPCRRPRSPVAPASSPCPARPGKRTGLQKRADRRVQRIAVRTLRQAACGCGVRHRPQTGKRIGSEATDAQHMMRGIRHPLADCDERVGPGQHRRDGRAQQRGGRIPQPSRIAGIGDPDQERRRSATSLEVRSSAGEPSCPSAEGMGDCVRAGTVSLGSHGSRQPHDHQYRACSALRGPLPHNGHEATSLTRPANRTNPSRAMPLPPPGPYTAWNPI